MSSRFLPFIRPAPWCLAALLASSLTACTVGPDYQRPSVAMPASFKEGGTRWQRMDVPATVDASSWWKALDDAELDALVVQAQRSNQTLAKAEAAWRQAQANVASARAQSRPTLSLGADASRGSNEVSRQLQQALGSSAANAASPVTQSVQVQASASWEPDLWGRVRREVESQQANRDAAADQLAAQQLSLTGSVIGDYLSLRQLDGDIAVLARQRALYRRLLQITEAASRQGTASPDDLLNARNNVSAATVGLANARIQRAQYEHAIAVLCGRPPSGFSIAPRDDYRFVSLPVPPVVPSQVVRRRPDIAAVERQVAAANAQIGVARAAYFPSLSLGASGGYSGDSIDDLFSLPHRIWSLGPQLAGTIFDGGARRAAVAGAEAGYDGAVAQYRQTVLSAFQEVEDDLSAWRQRGLLADQQRQVLVRQQTLLAHRRQQRALGTASDQDVLTENLGTLSAQRDAIDAQAARSQAAVALRLAVGGAIGVPAPATAKAFRPGRTRPGS